MNTPHEYITQLFVNHNCDDRAISEEFTMRIAKACLCLSVVLCLTIRIVSPALGQLENPVVSEKPEEKENRRHRQKRVRELAKEGDVLIADEQFERAHKTLHEIVQLQTQLSGTGSWQVVNMRLLIARIETEMALSPIDKKNAAIIRGAKERVESTDPKAIPRSAWQSFADVVKEAERIWGPRNTEFMEFLDLHARVHFKRGELRQANEIAKRLVSLQLAVRGKQNPKVIPALILLGLHFLKKRP